jgi:DNA processing protein
MSQIDEDTRDVLAGLSLYVGRALPAALIDTARAHGARVGRWAYPRDLDAAVNDGEQSAQQLRELGRSLRQRAAAAGISMLVRGDTGWPAGTGCDDLPCLWVRGNTDIAGLLARAVAVTGDQACSNYGAVTATNISTDLADAGWTVIANTGSGIDARAADAALAVGSRPVLLTAGGLDREFAEPINSTVEQAVQRGAVISPFPVTAQPTRARFQLRNQLLCTLSVATVLVEAEIRSDTLRALRAAADSGRVVCAVPGLVTSAVSTGCHQLIADGTARLVTCAYDVIRTIESPGGSTPTDGLFAVRAVASGLDDLSRIRHVPLFHVRALSHAHAANTAFDVLFDGHRGPTELNAGIHDAAGGYEAITISVEG